MQQFRAGVCYTKEDTNEHLSFETQKRLWKNAKEKGISVAELVRRIIDQDLDREPKQEG